VDRPEPSDADRQASRDFFLDQEDPVSGSVLNAALPHLLARVRAEGFREGVEAVKARIRIARRIFEDLLRMGEEESP